MNKIIVGVVGVLVVLGGVYTYSNNQREVAVVDEKKMEAEKASMEEGMAKEQMKEEVMQKDDEMSGDADQVMNKDDKEMMDKDAEIMEEKEDELVMKKEESAMVKSGSYESYSPEKIARASTGEVVLFFHASWCPSCRGLSANIEQNMKEIPEGVTILKVDYDKETELKKKYGVTYQHTLVQVDKDGNLIKKWSGGASLGTVLSEIE